MKLTLSESIIKNELNYVVVIAGLVIILGFLYWQYKDKSEKGSYLTNQMDRLSTFTVITMVVLAVLTLVVPSGFKPSVENPSVMLESIELSDSHKGVYFYPKGLNPTEHKDYYLYKLDQEYRYALVDKKVVHKSKVHGDGFIIERETLKDGLRLQRKLGDVQEIVFTFGINEESDKEALEYIKQVEEKTSDKAKDITIK